MRAILAVAVCGLAVGFASADETKSVAREIELKGYEANFKERGDVANPVKITSAEELTKALPGKAVPEKVGKQVDFSKEYLLLFRWSGSGGDELIAGGDKKATFTLRRGLTKDLRAHLRLFAVAKGAEWELAK